MKRRRSSRTGNYNVAHLIPEHVATYQQEGSLIVKDVFSEAEIAVMVEAVERGGARRRVVTRPGRRGW